jgi:uncharacterized protein with PQ loop repeat
MSLHSLIRHRNHTEKHDSKLRKFVDEAIYVFAILGPAASIPQVYNAIILKEIEGLSLFTWFSWNLISCFWLIYGILHKDKPIIISSTLWILTQSIVIIAILLYS